MPGNAFALHYAAMAHYTQANELNTAQAGGAAIYTEVTKAFGYSQAYWALEDRNQTYPVDLTWRIENVGIPTEEPTNLRKDLTTSLLNFYAFAQVAHPFISGTEPPTACTDNVFYWDILAARGWFTEHPEGGTVALSLAERMAAPCPLKNKGGGMELLQDPLLNLRLDYAEDIAATDEARTRELIAAIKTYRDAALKPGETENYYWHDYDASKLSRIEAMLPAIVSIPTGKEDPLVSAGPLPVEEWFLETSPLTQVNESIGQTYNAYVSANGSTGFVSAMGKMYALTRSAPDPAAARQILYQVSALYDDGRWRSADTKEADILDVAYKWLKDYKDE
ncbi:MAG: hypothetical protein R3C04_09650 [Hyphomonas sp.]